MSVFSLLRAEWQAVFNKTIHVIKVKMKYWSYAITVVIAAAFVACGPSTKDIKEKNKEIESVKRNTASLKEVTETIHTISAETITLREELMRQFSENMRLFGADYNSLDEADRMRLGAMVNNTKALSALFSRTV